MGQTLLIELLTEELPPRSLKKLSQTFAAELMVGLRREHLATEPSTATSFATPRRLAVSITAVQAQAPAQAVEMKGPTVAVALDEAGKPKPALLGFAKKCGVAVEQLARASDAKGEYFVYRSTAQGASLASAISGLIEDAARKLPVAKVMRWGGGEAEFVRPVKGVLILLGREQIRIELFDAPAKTTHTTLGHRFLAKSESVHVPAADAYERALEQDGKVIASFEKRQARIQAQLQEKARGAQILMDESLLEEVAALTEWPVVYEGQFDESFLSVPQECLILTMQQNQRYFPLADANGKLINRFLVVSNLETADPGRIVVGNERVLRARLADAKFFFDQDRKSKLETRVPRLGDVVYHNKLGSQLERVQRIQKLAGEIARRLGADSAVAERAAYLCKADLLTDMVGEFPQLQGTMGQYYARHDGEPESVARAIRTHYYPRFANDEVAPEGISASVALADKLDTLVGIFGIGLVPTGDKDPFGLRRHAVGVLRTLVERSLPLDLRDLLQHAAGHFPRDLLSSTVAADVYAFMLERLRNYLREAGYAPDEVEAVTSQNPARIDLVPARLKAVQEFKRLPEAQALASANKRIQNILKKTAASTSEPDPALLREPAEKALFAAVNELAPMVTSEVAAGKYAQALTKLAGLRAAVDTFFDKVMVMTEDAALRDNRLALLNRLASLMNQVADISKLSA
jgi:glycyl-tRNA synthetase beta chain